MIALLQGYIDLSKRRVSAEEAKKCEEKFNKGKQVNSILRHVAETQKCDIEMLYEKTAWKLDQKFKGPAKSYDAFRAAIADHPEIWDEIELEDGLKKVLMENVKRRLTPQPIKIRSDIEVACYAYEGINAVKDALRAGLDVSDDELDVKINLIAPPLYVVTTVALDKEKGIEMLNKSLNAIKEVLGSKEGIYNVKVPPRVVSNVDDNDLKLMIQKLDMQSQLHSDDEPDMDHPANKITDKDVDD
jgi:translation initiation factor 2 subunit 1